MKGLPCVVALLLPLLAGGAEQPSAAFTVQSAVATARDGAYQIDARIHFPVNDDVRSALDKGAAVRLALQVVIEKQRRYWFDKDVVEATLRRQLSWDAVSQRYLLKYLDRGEQDSFLTVDEALAAAGVIDGWRIAVDSKLDPDKAYEIRVRAGYRSSTLPDKLRALAFWSDGWVHRTEWKSWILPR